MGERGGDRIGLRGMRFLGRHGVTLAERMEPQPFEVDVALHLDLATAGASDDLADTVDYATVFEEVRAAVEGGSFRLIEALANRIAGDLLGAHPLLNSVEVAVRKPRAPLPGPFETVEVRVRRAR